MDELEIRNSLKEIKREVRFLNALAGITLLSLFCLAWAATSEKKKEKKN